MSDHDTTPSTCTCQDPQVERLRELIAAGYTQRDASLFLWDTPEPGSPLVLAHAGREARHHVRTAFAAAFPWLRLPATPREVR